MGPAAPSGLRDPVEVVQASDEDALHRLHLVVFWAHPTVETTGPTQNIPKVFYISYGLEIRENNIWVTSLACCHRILDKQQEMDEWKQCSNIQ